MLAGVQQDIIDGAAVVSRVRDEVRVALDDFHAYWYLGKRFQYSPFIQYVQAPFQSATLNFNSMGFRGPEFVPGRTAGVRLAFFGASAVLGVPNATDDVFIGGAVTDMVTVRSGTQAVATLTSDARLLVSAGTLSVTGDLQLRGGLRHLGLPMPEGKVPGAAAVLAEVARVALRSAFPRPAPVISSDTRALFAEAARVHTRITETCYYTEDALHLFWSGLRTINLGELAGRRFDYAKQIARGRTFARTIREGRPAPVQAQAISNRAQRLLG